MSGNRMTMALTCQDDEQDMCTGIFICCTLITFPWGKLRYWLWVDMYVQNNI